MEKKRIKIFCNRGSAYLIAIGVIGVLILIGVTISRMTLSGRWRTAFISYGRRAEETAEAAANLTFRIVQDEMNDQNSFFNLLSDQQAFLRSWFMHFRLPAPVAEAYLDAVTFENAVDSGMDIQLDLFNQVLFRPIYENGTLYIYDTVSPDPDAPLAPLAGMLESMGGRVRVECTAKISSAFGILASRSEYPIPGITVETTKVTGFLSNLVDRIDGSGIDFEVDLTELVPDIQLLEAPEIPWSDTYSVAGVPVPIRPILQPVLDRIFERIQDNIGLDTRTIARTLFGGNLSFKLNFGDLQDRIQQSITNMLPEYFTFFSGNAGFDVTVEKQGLFEVVVKVEYSPRYPHDGPVITRRLLVEREFRVADIQPVAPDHSFFVGNSRLPYENEEVENADDWQGNEQIDFNRGMGFLKIRNFRNFDALEEGLSNLSSLDLRGLCQNLKLPGRVRVNGTLPMDLRLGMFPRFPPTSTDELRRMEIMGLLLRHDPDAPGGQHRIVCRNRHEDATNRHDVVPGYRSVRYNFWHNGRPFDWGYFSNASVGGSGSYWLPIVPIFRQTMLFGNFHLEFPLSMRVEGNLRKIFSHLKILLVRIYIPPIPPLGIPEFEIPIPWLWARNYAEPYGFCRYLPYETEEEAQETWDPNNPENIPPNLYAPSQYLKKASYFYETSRDFVNDIPNRSRNINGRSVFICDGVTFVNDNLWLPELHVMGRGKIVAAANIHIQGDITRQSHDERGNPTIFSLVARNGALVNNYRDSEIYANIFADRGFYNTIGSSVRIFGNLVVNRFDEELCQGEIEVIYESNHTRSSLISLIKPIAKFDPMRYHVTMSSRTNKFEFLKTEQ